MAAKKKLAAANAVLHNNTVSQNEKAPSFFAMLCACCEQLLRPRKWWRPSCTEVSPLCSRTLASIHIGQQRPIALFPVAHPQEYSRLMALYHATHLL